MPGRQYICKESKDSLRLVLFVSAFFFPGFILSSLLAKCTLVQLTRNKAHRFHAGGGGWTVYIMRCVLFGIIIYDCEVNQSTYIVCKALSFFYETACQTDSVFIFWIVAKVSALTASADVVKRCQPHKSRLGQKRTCFWNSLQLLPFSDHQSLKLLQPAVVVAHAQLPRWIFCYLAEAKEWEERVWKHTGCFFFTGTPLKNLSNVLGGYQWEKNSLYSCHAAFPSGPPWPSWARKR